MSGILWTIGAFVVGLLVGFVCTGILTTLVSKGQDAAGKIGSQK